MRRRIFDILCLVKGKKERYLCVSILFSLRPQTALRGLVYKPCLPLSKHEALGEIFISEFVCHLPETNFLFSRNAKKPKKRCFQKKYLIKKKRKKKKMVLKACIQQSFSAVNFEEQTKKRMRCMVYGAVCRQPQRITKLCLPSCFQRHLHMFKLKNFVSLCFSFVTFFFYFLLSSSSFSFRFRFNCKQRLSWMLDATLQEYIREKGVYYLFLIEFHGEMEILYLVLHTKKESSFLKNILLFFSLSSFSFSQVKRIAGSDIWCQGLEINVQ